MATLPAGGKPAPRTKKPADADKGSVGKAAPDWERIELDYRAGIKTLRQIAEESGITHGAINKRARRDGWDRDLSAKIKAKAEALVSKALVSDAVSKERRITEQQLVEAAATTSASVQISHRKDIERTRRLTNALLHELEQATDPETLEKLKALADIMANPDERTGRDRMNEVYQAVISLPERSKTLKVLTESLQKTVDMERQAFGMDKDSGAGEGDALSKLLSKLTTGNGNGFSPVSVDPERKQTGMPMSATEPDDED